MFRPFRFNDIRSRLSALAVSALMLLGLLGGMGGTAACAAVLASSGGQHTVALSVDVEHFRVVLRHQSQSIGHNHGWASRLVMLLAERSNRANGDHVLQFDRLDDLRNATARAIAVKRTETPGNIVDFQQGAPAMEWGVTPARLIGWKAHGWPSRIPPALSTVCLI